MSVRADLTEDALEQFFALPIVLQEPLEIRLQRLAETEAMRDQGLAPTAQRRHRFHSFNLDLGDDYWHEISVTTLFIPVGDLLRVYSIDYQPEEK